MYVFIYLFSFCTFNRVYSWYLWQIIHIWIEITKIVRGKIHIYAIISFVFITDNCSCLNLQFNSIHTFYILIEHRTSDMSFLSFVHFNEYLNTDLKWLIHFMSPCVCVFFYLTYFWVKLRLCNMTCCGFLFISGDVKFKQKINIKQIEQFCYEICSENKYRKKKNVNM